MCVSSYTKAFILFPGDETNLAVEENDSVSDSDEAPDDVSFSQLNVASRSNFFHNIIQARQKKQALEQEQKAKTLQSLASKRLPEIIVDFVSGKDNAVIDIQTHSKHTLQTSKADVWLPAALYRTWILDLLNLRP